ncbi:MAG TPA: Gldg family protein, partial [Anaerolineales bacterium]|nr:Gldg family protein [Anaerolineales bacterium]
ASETELTKSLIRLINPESRVVYFLTGHGEASLDSGDVSVSTAKRTLESKNYVVNSLNLVADNKIPDDALAVIIAGPLKPVSKPEVDLLKKYVDGGGSLVVMENPILVTEFGDSPDPLASYLNADWGIGLDNDVIIDLSSQQPLNAVSYSANQHPITQNLSQNYLVIMPQARSVGITSTPEGVTQTPLIQTSPNSWGEVKFTNAQGTQISQDPEDFPGPLTMAAAGENTTTKGRVVVVGNSIFAEDKGFDAYGNGNFFINSVDWAAEQEDLINITPNTPTERTFVPPTQIQLLIVLIGSVILIPGLIVFAGISSWLARRRQG